MPKGLTPFGCEVRKLRIEAKTSLKAMAEYLAVKSSYLSGVETGDRPLSAAVLERTIAFFKVRFDIDATHLRDVAAGMRTAVDVGPLDEHSRAGIAEFARRLCDIPRDERHEVLEGLIAGLKNRG